MRLPKLTKGKIINSKVLENKSRVNSLLAIIQYELNNGEIIYEIAPISYEHKKGQTIGYYPVQFINQRYLYNIIRL